MVGLVKGSGFEMFTKRGILAWDRSMLLYMYIRIRGPDAYQYGATEPVGK